MSNENPDLSKQYTMVHGVMKMLAEYPADPVKIASIEKRMADAESAYVISLAKTQEYRRALYSVQLYCNITDRKEKSVLLHKMFDMNSEMLVMATHDYNRNLCDEIKENCLMIFPDHKLSKEDQKTILQKASFKYVQNTGMTKLPMTTGQEKDLSTDLPLIQAAEAGLSLFALKQLNMKLFKKLSVFPFLDTKTELSEYGRIEKNLQNTLN